MWKRSITLGLMFALSVGGAVWAQRAVDARPVTGRVSIVDPLSETVTVDTPGGRIRLKVGDEVSVRAPSGVAVEARSPRTKRRLLPGLSGLAIVGALLYFRARRPLTI